MKCARCEHQWLLVPESDEPIGHDDLQAEQDAPAQTPQPASEHHDVFSRRTPQHDWGATSSQAGSFAASGEPESDASAPDREPADTEAADYDDWNSEPDVRTGGHDTEPERRDPFSFGTPARDAQDDEWDDDAYDAAAAETRAPFADTPTENESENAAATPSWRTRQDRYSAAISTLSEPVVSDYASQTEPAAQHDPTGDEFATDSAQTGEPDANESSWWSRLGRRAEPAAQSVDDPSGDVSQEEDFETPRFLQQEPEEEAPSPERRSWASRFMRLRRSREEDPAADDAAEADAEDDLRRALDAALEHPGTHTAPRSPQGFDERFSRDDDPEAADDDPYFAHAEADRQNAGFPLGFSDDGDSARPSPSRDLDSLSYASMKADPEAADEEQEDPPFRLTGDNARAPVYRSGRLTDEEIGDRGEDRFESSAFEEDLDQAFGEDRHQTKPSAAPDDLSRQDDFDDDFGDLYDRQFARGGSERDPSDVLDDDNRILEEDLAELQSELSATDVMAYEREPRSGGLAVIAAWAVFISVLSGVTLALVSFRQDIMTAFPGTTSLYRTIGFDIPHVGVDFADVRYRWATSGGAPMIEVTGQVVNVTGRTVQVPPVLVNVRDSGGGDAVRATASVQTKELAPRQSASFSLEFMSPPENVTQIELEFDRSASARP